MTSIRRVRKIFIKVKLYATLRKHLPGIKLGEIANIEISESDRVKDVIMQLGINPEQAKIILVNHDKKTEDYILQENDLLVIFPPIGGGNKNTLIINDYKYQ